jgi:hypothetical protein
VAGGEANLVVLRPLNTHISRPACATCSACRSMPRRCRTRATR